jgi:ATP-dependent exoDNAse (exonuclease V) beta subunit
LASDFMNSRSGPDSDAESEVRLFYVAMTRAKRLLIAEPELLRTFTTDAWRTKQTEARPFSARGAAPGSKRQPQPGPRLDIREINPRARRTQHPGVATTNRSTPTAESTRPSPGDPKPVAQQGLRGDIMEITPAARVMRHPGAATTVPPADDATRSPAGNQKVPERGKFWRHVARLFGVS